jgi:predicted Zn-dependent peptidase
MGVVAKLQRGDFTDADLEGAVLATEVARARQLETSWGRVQLMDSAFTTDTPWADVVGQAARIRAVTRADIVRVASQYLGGDFVAVRRIKGVASPAHLTKPRITPYHIDPTRHSAFADAVLAMPVTPIEPVAVVEGADYQRGKLATGELVTVENHRNELGYVSYSYDYGSRDDRLACLALDALEVAGAGDRSAEQLSRDLYALGVTFSVSCGADRSSITVDGIDRNLDRALALLHDHVAAPHLDADLVAREIATTRTARANTIDDPGDVKQAVHAFAHYGDDSEWRVVASDRQLGAATPAQLAKIIARYLTMAHRTAYFGPRTAAAVAPVVGFGDGKLPTTPRAPWHYRPAGAVIACDRDTAQTDISIVWPRPPATDDERALGELFYYYAGQRVFREVRGARGLAYAVWAGYGAGGRARDDAAVWAAAGTQADKTDETLAALFEVLRQPVDDERLAEAKQRVEEQHRTDRIDPRNLAGTVYGWEDQGVRADPRDGRVKRMLVVERGRLDAWASRIVAGKPIVSVVGPRKLMDEGKLAKIAPVTWIPAARAFGY